jgi:hypothetical protein
MIKDSVITSLRLGEVFSSLDRGNMYIESSLNLFETLSPKPYWLPAEKGDFSKKIVILNASSCHSFW